MAGRFVPIFSKLKRTTALSRSDWRHLAIAVLELFAARVRLTAIPPAKLLRGLQSRLPVPSADPGAARAAAITVERVGWAIRVAAHVVPWRSDCLVQAMAASNWLRRKKLNTAFYLGVYKDTNRPFEAHAWIRHETQTVTGGRVQKFVPLIEPQD